MRIIQWRIFYSFLREIIYFGAWPQHLNLISGPGPSTNKPDLPRTSLRKRSVNVWGLLVAKYVGWKVEEALLLPP